MVTVEVDLAEASGRPHGGNRADLAVTAMEIEQVTEVDVRQAVAVGQKEIVPFDIAFDALDPATGHGVESGLGERHVPVFLGKPAVERQLLRSAQVTAKIGVGQVVIEEIALDRPALVAEAQDEILEAEMGVA